MEFTLRSGNWETQIIAKDIDAAKEMSDQEITYNQEGFGLYDADDNLLTARSWWGCLDNIEESEDPIQFGEFGFYSDWQDK